MLPVSRVVVMEDRAQVEREGPVQLAGVTRLEVEGLPLVAVDRSLRVEVRGGTLLEARLERRWTAPPPGGLAPDATALRQRVESLRLELLRQTDVVAQLEGRAEVLDLAREEVLRAMRQRTGEGDADVETWRTQLQTVSAQQAELDEARHAAKRSLQTLQQRQHEAQRALATEPPTQQRSCVLVLRVDGAGEAHVRVSYLVPCAVWRPAYRATLASGQVTLEAEGVVWQRTGEDWDDVELRFSTARPTLGTTPPTLEDDVLHLRLKLAQEKHTVDVTLREEAIQSAGEASGELPGLDDGGEARLLTAPARTSVKSDGQPQRVGLFSFTAPATVERICPAELSSLVYVIARFTAGQLLLAGPVDLLRDSGLVGRGQLRFAAAGETVKLSFGNEDGLQVVRESDEKVEEAMLTGRRTTTRRVKLHVSNTRPEATRLIVEERVPVSEVKEVEVQVLTRDCAPAPSTVTREGIARIELELAAQSTKTARFSWELSAAAKVSGV